MLHIVYFSNISENTHRFIQRLHRTAENNNQPLTSERIPVKGTANTVNQDYILIAPSYGTEKTGHVPPQIKKFLTHETTRNHCVGVIGAGNLNFGPEFAVSGDVLAQKLGIPLLHKMELSGFDKDITTLLKLTQLNKQTINDIHQRNQQAA